MLASFTSDLRGALRGLRRNPAFTLMAVASLALGMGANGTMLTLVRGLVWSELPVPEAERLVRVFERDERGPRNFSYPNYRDLADAGVFDGVLAHDLATFGLQRGDRTQVIHGELVSRNYFDVLRVQPAAGRPFSADAGAAEEHDLTAVISHHLWQTSFGGDPGVVGRLVKLSGAPALIVAVAPASFNGTKLGLGMDVWVPVEAWARAQGWQPLEERRGSRWLNVVARLSPGRGRDEAQAGAAAVAARLQSQYAQTNRNIGFVVTSEAAGNFGGHGESLTATIGGIALVGAGLVLLVACGNVAALLLARGATRRREIAVRRALGASRSQVLRHFLAESLVLAGAATALGVLLARLAAPLLLAALPPLPYRFAVTVAPDTLTLTAIALAGLVTALLCGLVPALRATREAGPSALQSEVWSTSAPARLRPLAALAALTLAFGCVTLVLSGVFTRSLQAAHAARPGFETSHRVTASMDVALAGAGATTPQRYFGDLLEALARLPETRGVAVASNLPLTDRQETSDVFDAAQPASPDEPGLEAWTAAVSESYFEVLGQPLLAGRAFSPADRSGPAVVIVSQALAERLWTPADAVGRRLRIGRTVAEVVGVAADAKYGNVSEAPRPALYLPFWQDPTTRAEVVVLGAADDPGLTERFVTAARAVDPRVPVFSAKTLAVHLDGSLWMFRVAAGLAAGLGLLAAGLALAGLYGVMAYGVERRRSEIGIRLALGATRGTIVAWLLARGARVTAAGLVLGLLGAAVTTQLARAVIFGVSPHDPLAFLGVAAAVTALALLACLVPSLSAARTDPARSLRAN